MKHVKGVARRANKFRQDVQKQMNLTVANLHPDVAIGATDGSGDYIEIQLNFRSLRIRITKEIVDRRHDKVWVEVGATCDPAAFFRMDLVFDALRRLDKASEIPTSSSFPSTLSELDSIIWSTHGKLDDHLSPTNYVRTRTVVGQVMCEYFTWAHREPATIAVKVGYRPSFCHFTVTGTDGAVTQIQGGWIVVGKASGALTAEGDNQFAAVGKPLPKPLTVTLDPGDSGAVAEGAEILFSGRPARSPPARPAGARSLPLSTPSVLPL
jgi:hypothetical protein